MKMFSVRNISHGICAFCGKELFGRGNKFCNDVCYHSSPQFKAQALRNANNGGKKGRKYPAQLISVIKIDGRKRPCNMSEVTRKKISAANTGSKRTASSKRLMSLRRKGHSLSIITKQKISAATSGSNNAHWKGGITSTPYSYKFRSTLRYQVRIRDKYTCQKCGCTDRDALRVHHIDENKLNDALTNLTTLCTSCHGIIHKANWRKKLCLTH